MEEWVVGKYVGNWGQRKYVEKDEKYGGNCEQCCDAGRGNIQIYMLIFYKELHRMYTITQSVQGIDI